jgi:hypothetical protein
LSKIFDLRIRGALRRCDIGGQKMNETGKKTPVLEIVEAPFRTCTASAKVTESEFAALEKMAISKGKRLGEWVREVLLQELNGQESFTLLLAEVLGIRMIVLNILAPILRGEKPSTEELQKLLAQVDTNKTKRAVEKLRELRTAQNGGR